MTPGWLQSNQATHLDHPEELCLVETARDTTENVFADTQSLHCYLRVKVWRAEYDHQSNIFPQENIVHSGCKEGNIESARHGLGLGEHTAPNCLNSESLILQLPHHPPGSGGAAEHSHTR